MITADTGHIRTRTRTGAGVDLNVHVFWILVALTKSVSSSYITIKVSFCKAPKHTLVGYIRLMDKS